MSRLVICRVVVPRRDARELVGLLWTTEADLPVPLKCGTPESARAFRDWCDDQGKRLSADMLPQKARALYARWQTEQADSGVVAF